MINPPRHFLIPDTQVKKGVPIIHLQWIGRYLAEKQPEKIIMIGDWYDMPSLSSYDKGKLQFAGRRFDEDIAAGHKALEVMMAPINEMNARRKKKRQKLYKPEKHVCWGNHEDRIRRAVENQSELEGFIGLHLINEYWEERGWIVHQFGEVVDIDGIWYTHCMLNEMTGRPYGAIAATMLKTIGHTFTQGHRQVYDLATRYVGMKMQRALIAGACYLHEEEYKGPPRDKSVRSGNHHWRGCVLKHDVEDGEYSLMELPLDFFCRRYEKRTLKKFRGINRILA